MQQILIPLKRAKLLDNKLIKELEEKLKCTITVEESSLTISGEPFEEYNARNVITAFGRGFELKNAFKLLLEDYFFKTINLKEIFKSKDKIISIKGRIIGKEGKTKEYIESVSGALISVYGGTVSIIGTNNEITIAEAAINTLIDGGTHKKAYRVMEAARKKIRISDIHGR
ncbi:MAG: KH domain-containing protein [Candidatus Micrarchaeia archaeon]